MKLESLSFSDRFDVLEKRLSGIAGLRYTMVYGNPSQSQMKDDKYEKSVNYCALVKFFLHAVIGSRL